MERFQNQCLIPEKDRERFSEIAYKRGKTFYEICARKNDCPVSGECRFQWQGSFAMPYNDYIRVRTQVIG